MSGTTSARPVYSSRLADTLTDPYEYDPGHRDGMQTLPIALRSAANGIPFVDVRYVNVGNMLLSVRNDGAVGPDTYLGSGLNNDVDLMEYPFGTNSPYPTPRLVVGGVSGRDTLVTWVQEWWPPTLENQAINNEGFIVRSINDTGSLGAEAHSEQDISCVFYDTLVDQLFTGLDSLDNRAHRPLNLRVLQTTYAWGFEFSQDFVIFDYLITNIGKTPIEDAYLGVEVRGGFEYGIVGGYLDTFPALNLRSSSCKFLDTLQLFWSADNDGEPVGDEFDPNTSPTGVSAIKFLKVPEGATKLIYNWWDDNSPAQDWGPRRRGTPESPFRSFGQRMGTPLGDRNRYYMMSTEEFDYDQMFTALDHTNEGWLPPPAQAVALATGPNCGNHNHHWHMITVGPVTIPPGGSVPLVFAYVMGANFHRDPTKVFDPFNPQEYYKDFHFDDVARNATWASWVYDNPGIDTDDDGYRGEFRLCIGDSTLVVDTTILVDTFQFPPDTTIILDSMYDVLSADTLYYTGDGVPDIRAASPPPAPEVRFTPSYGEIRVEWNGLRSETTPDVFTDRVDFEGYRVYLGLDRTSADMTLQRSFDIEDFTQFFFEDGPGNDDWVVLRPPFSLREVQDAYADGRRDYDPLSNGIDNPLRVGDSLFYFVSQDWNQFDLTDPLGIRKTFPDEPPPHTLSLDSAFTTDTFLVNNITGDTTFYPDGELTPDGKRFKFYEYNYTMRGLLPSQRYFASVTAFDYGSQEANLPFLETNPVTSAIEMFALDRVEQSAPGGLDVVVYPNPYRGDGSYRRLGFEGRGDEDLPDERVRAVNFINLPPQCTIFIYSLDGDLVNQLDHDQPPNSPTAMHEKWDLITRNTQLAVSGIYYWVVETPAGDTQVGKLVLIL